MATSWRSGVMWIEVFVPSLVDGTRTAPSPVRWFRYDRPHIATRCARLKPAGTAVNSQPAPITALNHTLDNEPQQITAPLTHSAAFLVLKVKDDETSIAK